MREGALNAVNDTFLAARSAVMVHRDERDLVYIYLSADGEEGLSGRIHEDDLGAARRGIVVNSEDKVSIGVENGETAAVEEERFTPDCERCRFRFGGDGRKRR
ncbi:hypothetical protein M5K25_006564 [Dendrobium thyrsiflorum]|uniref:Uncharacterized protein n=1 Tax=Dendrobium thyrsiflorum TaxID=117978 RepID=A0ABD0VJ72_DENTH